MRVGNMSLGLPKPGKATLGMLVGILAIWVMYASALNWGEADPAIVAPFLGSTSKVLHGQIWRLFTAPLIHVWAGDYAVSHLITTLFGIYFFGTALESRWGARRYLLFLFGTAAFGFLCQMVAGSLVPKLGSQVPGLPADVWIGGLGMVDAVAVAWALQARPGSQVLLMFVLPISPMVLLAVIFGFNVLKVFAIGMHPEGLVTPFGGMLAGYLLCDASPLRRYWLQLRLKTLQRQAETLRTAPRKRAAASGLRVIPGGASEDPKDKRYLN